MLDELKEEKAKAKKDEGDTQEDEEDVDEEEPESEEDEGEDFTPQRAPEARAVSETKKTTTRKGLTKAAKEVLTCPPNRATEESHKWQSLFVEVHKGMPANNKLDPEQEVKIDEKVATKALNLGRELKKVFPVVDGERYGEENDRPRVIGVVAGFVALVGGDPKAIVKTGPVRYFVSTTIDGVDVLVETRPPGHSVRAKSEALEKLLHHGDLKSKKWKMDLLLYSKVDENVSVPRVLVEAKGDDASFLDLYQASSSGWNLLLKRLQDELDIERLYLEVWGTQSYFYGILDIFGYVTVKNGTVTVDSFNNYKATVEKRKDLRNLPEDSYSRCPQTLKELQEIYNRQARRFSGKYHCDLPSQHGQEDFPVGVVYFSNEPRLMPTGRHEKNVTLQENCAFVQGHLRILGSNSAVAGDDCSQRLLHNYKTFKKGIGEEGLGPAVLAERKKLPVPPMYRRVAQSSERTIELFDNFHVEPFHGNAGEASSSLEQDVWTVPPSKRVVEGWGVAEVANLVQLASGSDKYNDAIFKSKVDGSTLVVMNPEEFGEWLKELDIPFKERLDIKRWWLSMTSRNQ